MSEVTRGKKRNKFNIKEEDYYDRSGCLNMTIWDIYGNKLPKTFTTRVVDAVNKMAADEGFGFSFTKS